MHAAPCVAKRSALQVTGAAANPRPAKRCAHRAAGSAGSTEAFSCADVAVAVQCPGGAGIDEGPPSKPRQASRTVPDSHGAGAQDAPPFKAWPMQHTALKYAAEWPKAAGGAGVEQERPCAQRSSRVLSRGTPPRQAAQVGGLLEEAHTSLPRLVFVSFGTRTLAQVCESAAALEMARAMWPPRSAEPPMFAKQRRALFDPRRARRAVLDALASSGAMDCSRISLGDVYLFDCTCLHGEWKKAHGGDKEHVGLHVSAVEEYVQTRKNKEALLQLVRQFRALRLYSTPASAAVCAFYCNRGEHRSVAMRYLFGHYAQLRGFGAVQCVDLCSGLWSRRGCGGCEECCAARRTPERLRLEESFVAFVDAQEISEG